MENKYNKSFIYQITCNDPNITETYVGSTTDFHKRKIKHKTNCLNNSEKNTHYNLKVYNFIRENGGWDNFNIKIIEEFSCENKNELLTRERYFIELLKSNLNTKIPTRTQEEFRLENKEYLNEKQKQYDLNNRDKITEYKKQYRIDNNEKIKNYHTQYYIKNKNKILEKIICDICNSEVRKTHLARHKKSLKCMKFQKLIENEN